jgi:hypothetical protein
VFFRKKYALESWLTLECTIEGQKNTYKLHRIELTLAAPKQPQEDQEIRLPVLSEKLKNISLKFQELSLKKGK